MRYWTLVAAALVLAGVGPALAVVGTTTIKVTDGAKAVPEASVTITFKDQTGKRLTSVRRKTGRTSTPRIRIPDNTKTVDISVTTSSGRREQRTDIDVGLLIDKEFTIDVPGAAPPSRTAGPPQDDVPPEAPTTPDGPVIGLGFGGQTTSCNNWRTDRIEIEGFALDPGEHPEGCFSSAFRASIYLGTSWRVAAAWLVGIEGDFGVTNSTTTRSGIPGSIGSVPGVTPAVAANDSVSFGKIWDASLRGRFGYFITPTTVVYATGGVAFQQIDVTVNCTVAGACGAAGVSASSVSNRTILTGWTVGGGVDVAVNRFIVLRGEYRYADYGTFSSTFGSPTSLAVFSDIDLRTHTALIGVGVKLGALR